MNIACKCMSKAGTFAKSRIEENKPETDFSIKIFWYHSFLAFFDPSIIFQVKKAFFITWNYL